MAILKQNPVSFFSRLSNQFVSLLFLTLTKGNWEKFVCEILNLCILKKLGSWISTSRKNKD
jgi:hypothetical protein